MKSYQLINTKVDEMPIIIDEDVVEDFCKLMEWTAEDFKKHTKEYPDVLLKAWFELKPHIVERFGSSGAIKRFEDKVMGD